MATSFARFLSAAIVLLASIVVGPAAHAHPHVFAECSVGVRFGAQGLEAVRLSWKFDEDSSRTILERFAPEPGGFTQAAIRDMEGEHARQFQPLGFFLDVRVDDTVVPVGGMQDFEARVERGVVTHRFTMSVAGPSSATEGIVQIDVVDPGHYMAFALVDPVSVEGAGPYLVDCRVARDAASQRPEGVKCLYRRRPT